MSKNDRRASNFPQRTNSHRQNAVVGCWPVPKPRPGSSTTTICPLRGLRLLQLGLISSDLILSEGRVIRVPVFAKEIWDSCNSRLLFLTWISMGLKCRFQDSAQSSRRTLAIVILPGPILNPHSLMRFSPAEILLRTSGTGLCSQKAETVLTPVFTWKQDETAQPGIAPSTSATASSASRVVAMEIRQSTLCFIFDAFLLLVLVLVLEQKDEYEVENEGRGRLSGLVAPRGEIEQFHLGHVRMQHDLRDARVFDLEVVRFRQRHVEKNGEHHADHAAVTKDGDVLSAMPSYDFAQARFDAGAEGFAALAVRRPFEFNLVEPFIGAETEPFADGLPAQPGPVAEIQFAQRGQNGLRRRAVFQQWRERLLDALHRTGVNRVNRFAAQIFGECLSLFAAARRKIHVNASAKRVLMAWLDFPVANQQQPRRGRVFGNLP